MVVNRNAKYNLMMKQHVTNLLFPLIKPFLKLQDILRRARELEMKRCLGGGKKLIQYPYLICGIENIEMAENVSIGPGATIYTTGAKLIFHEHVVAGPNLTIITGDHKHMVGRFIDTIKDEEKEAWYDSDVEIESDVWIGCNVTILKGVKIGRGSIIAAGAVVTKSFPPYSIIGGVPAYVIRQVYTDSEIKEHERILYGR